MIRTLLLLLAAVLISPPARADHIGIFADGTGSSCVLSVGVTTTATVIHKFATGATGARFRVDFSGATGSAYYNFNTTFTTVGTLNDDLSLGYGQCLSGSFVLGTVVALLAPGQIYVRPANGSSSIIYTNCSFAEIVASGGQASIDNSLCMANGTASATWGQIKSLYR